jgi:hypothetical protein
MDVERHVDHRALTASARGSVHRQRRVATAGRRGPGGRSGLRRTDTGGRRTGGQRTSQEQSA